MKKSFLVFVFMLFAVNSYASEWTGNLNFFLGQKSLDKDEWSPVEDQGEFGVLIDFRQKEWPVSIVIDLLGSSSEETLSGVKYTGTTTEIDLGIRKVWVPDGPIRPFIGGGIASIAAEFEGADGYLAISDDDSGIGFWLNGGVYWTIGRHFNIGLEVRYSQAEVTIFNIDAEAGGTHAGLLLGYHW